MRTCLFTSIWSTCLLASAATPCAGQEPGAIFTDPAAPLQPLTTRSEADELRLRAAVYAMEARIWERRGKEGDALTRYERAFRLDSDAVVLLQSIVPLALRLGRLGEAARYAAPLADGNFDDPLLAEQLAILLSDQGDYPRALRLHRRVLQWRRQQPEPGDLAALQFEIGRLSFLIGDHASAADAFRAVLQAVDADGGSPSEGSARTAILSRAPVVFTLMAESFLKARDFELAAELFKRAAGPDPQKTTEWLPVQLARVDLGAGRDQAAREKLEGYVRQRGRAGGQEPYRLLEELWQKLDGATAEQLVQRFRGPLTEDPDNIPLLLFSADLGRRSGELETAASLFEDSLRRQPTLDAFQGLTATYRQSRNVDKLSDVLGRAAAELRDLTPLSDELDQIVRDRELLGLLFQAGRRGFDAPPQSGWGLSAACGLLAIQAQQFQTADEFFAKLDGVPGESEVLTNWGVEMLLAGQPQRAANALQRVIAPQSAGSDQALVWYYLAGALELAGKTEEALDAASRAAALSDENPVVQLRRAWVLFHAQRYLEAEEAYLGWLQRHASDFSQPGVREAVRDARFVMSSICLAGERPEEASEWLERILDEFPDDAGAANDLGYLLADRGVTLQRAITMIQQAVRAEPDNAAYRDSLGWVLYRLGRFDEAIVELRKAAAVESPDPIILDHLGDALRSAGQDEAAREAWRRALENMSAAVPNSELQNSLETKLAQHVEESN